MDRRNKEYDKNYRVGVPYGPWTWDPAYRKDLFAPDEWIVLVRPDYRSDLWIYSELTEFDNDGVKYRIHRLDGMFNIDQMASWKFVPYYTDEDRISNGKFIGDFWKKHGSEMSTISIGSTYRGAMDQLERWIDDKRDDVGPTACWLIGFLSNLYNTGDPVQSKFLDDTWYQRYVAVCKNGATAKDISDWSAFLCKPTIKEHFGQKPVNMDLYHAYHHILERECATQWDI